MNYFELSFFGFVLLIVLGNWLLMDWPEWRRRWLVLGSIYFLYSWNWQSAVVAVVNSIFVFYWAQLIQCAPRKKLALGIGIGSQVLFLLVARIFFSVDIGGGYTSKFLAFAYFVGASYVVLQHSSYFVDVYYAKYAPERAIDRVLLYSTYFPKVLVGPIETYAGFQSEFDRASRKIDLFRALYLIAMGGFKGLVVSKRAIEVYSTVTMTFGADVKSMLFFWVAAVTATMAVYCDFSALTDIGRGVSLLVGVRLTEQFNQPYLASNPADHWKRWHISLGNWMRQYVFFPILVKTKNTYLAITTTMLVVALWHGFYTELFLWALSWAGLQCVHAYIQSSDWGLNWRNRLPGWLYRLISVVVTFHVSAAIGMLTFHRLFFTEKVPAKLVLIDETTLMVMRDNRLLGLFLLLVFVVESLERKGVSRYFYIFATVLFCFLVSAYMTGTSYLFYYMRL